MLSSKKEAIYQGYVQRWHILHPHYETPIRMKSVGIDMRTALPISNKCRHHGGDGEVLELADGRVVEIPFSNYWAGIVSVFKSKDSWSDYERPLTAEEYFENW